MKKRIALPYSLLILATGVAVFFMFKTDGLQRELNESEKAKIALDNQTAMQKELLRIDSMVVEGKYNEAIASYGNSQQTIDDGNKVIPLRIALARKLQKLKAENTADLSFNPALKDSIDSEKATPQEIRRYDSINFALEKAKVQLKGMQAQLRRKSFGEYLTFNSKKGNVMHYVGQVKNGMAYGTGIALLDTGSRYEGEWRGNKRHGEGIFYWSDGQRYEGTYEDDTRNGLGTYYWPNGEKYTGQWKQDKRNGQGTFYGKDGKVVKGIWKNDKLKEQAKS